MPFVRLPTNLRARTGDFECGGKRSAPPRWLRRLSARSQPKRRRRCALPAHSKIAPTQHGSRGLCDYRNNCETFLSNLVAQMFGFQPQEFFSVPPSVKEVPDVEFAR